MHRFIVILVKTILAVITIIGLSNLAQVVQIDQPGKLAAMIRGKVWMP